MLNFIVDRFLAPQRCHWCKAAVRGSVACSNCTASLPWNTRACRACALPLISAQSKVCATCLQGSPPQDSSWTAFRYETPVVQQILSLKFHGHLQSAHILGALMAARLAQRAEPLPELLIPVPLHTSRLRLRGYNQAVEIGRELSARLTLSLRPEFALRKQATREQTELSAVERRRNVRGVFTVDSAVAGRHIALLDDVITTGATIAELARMARKAGAARIEAWAVARA